MVFVTVRVGVGVLVVVSVGVADFVIAGVRVGVLDGQILIVISPF
jgi:hypothetical protein